MENDEYSASSGSDDDNDAEQPEVTEADEEERKKIREKISTMSFEDLQKLKEKIGSKIYNETVFGKSLPKPKTTKFKRLNKNRPREMSSKRPIKIRNQIEAVKRNLPRDPRFDPLSGNFDKKTFKANYSFLKDLKQKEVEQLKREYENETNVEKKKKIKFVIQRMSNQIREYEKNEKREKRTEDEKREIKEKLKHGEKPVFKKKSEKKVEDLVQKYEELKKTNKLQKHIERRSKKIAKRELKNM